ncbi:flagellar P-ring protein [Aliidongia dinghuensis]|uniref:Flagellar P-ring protein n=1 Tax=Aliidongia dinghuensis TaxID=1867774 RepID=A0A8J3E5V6_9PROT|nr:flagellar basal body P-ring protein FlgI [Aliidongia dinghuensis]GGF39009.1 flagellar P-ring protein [Aliidongia dinghuensis]
MCTIFRPLLASLVLLAAGFGSVHADAAVRLKDIVSFEGARDNLLVGYGLVVGLNGTGDDVTKSIFTRESVIGMLDRLGVNARDAQLTVRTKNVAAVMVTATLPSSARQGSRIDVSVSAMGDANNLQGGTLVGVPLLGADGEVYAVAQGQVSVGGFSAKGAAASITQGVPTAGKVPDGAIVEREVNFDFSKLQTMNLALRNPDFTTAERVATAINAYMHGDLARATDNGTVALAIPSSMRGDVVGLMTRLEQLRIEPDQVAKVVIDEANGVIVMGENVRISTVAVAEGNLTVKITETPQVSQPNAFAPGGNAAGGQTAPGQNGVQFAPNGGAATTVVPRTNIEVDTGKDKRLAVVPQGVSIQELVNSLNALGIGPRDMISILQAIKAAGAMQADLEVH